jgi:hypothetical protein
MQGSRNKGGDCETVSKGDSDDVVPGSFDCANPDEDERECSDEFSEQRAKFSHDVMQSDWFRVEQQCSKFGASHSDAATGREPKMSI